MLSEDILWDGKDNTVCCELYIIITTLQLIRITYIFIYLEPA